MRSIRDGLIYRNGVLAAELAMRGLLAVAACSTSLTATTGPSIAANMICRKLAETSSASYETDRVALKPWPTIRHIHMLITAVSDAMRENALSFDDVDHVTAFVGKINLGRCGPTHLGMVPRHRIDLLGNLPFAVAATLRHGGPSLKLYRDTALADDLIKNAVPKVRWEYDPKMDGPWTFEPGQVALVTKSGKTIKQRCDVALGNPDRPMSTAQRHQKVLDGAANAVPVVPKSRAREIIAAVERLEDMRDVATLAGLLA